MLKRPTGEVLICQRPPHKIYPGEWEFPGGKVEPGETAGQALARELFEELGIAVTRARRLIRLRHDYPELSVDLDTWLVEGWEGEPVSNEHPAIAWVAVAELPNRALLAADAPIVQALRLPSQLVITPPDFELSQACLTVPDSLLRLRLPKADDARYRATAKALCAEGLKPLLDRRPADAVALGAGGFHATTSALMALDQRPVPATFLFGASCHTAEELRRARQLGADYALLGPVLPTATHPGATTLGWEGFQSLAAGAGLPIYALGGLGPQDLPRAWEAGAQGIAGVSAFWGG